jgi:hypothetical protein
MQKKAERNGVDIMDYVNSMHAHVLNQRDEINRLRARLKEHEQFRLQHRDCDQMGIAIHQARLILNAVQSPPTRRAE